MFITIRKTGFLYGEVRHDGEATPGTMCENGGDLSKGGGDFLSSN